MQSLRQLRDGAVARGVKHLEHVCVVAILLTPGYCDPNNQLFAHLHVQMTHRLVQLTVMILVLALKSLASRSLGQKTLSLVQVVSLLPVRPCTKTMLLEEDQYCFICKGTIDLNSNSVGKD